MNTLFTWKVFTWARGNGGFTKLGKLFCRIVMATLFLYMAGFQLLLLWKPLIVEGKQLFWCIKSTVCAACRLFAKKNNFSWSKSGRRVEGRSLLINLAHIFDTFHTIGGNISVWGTRYQDSGMNFGTATLFCDFYRDIRQNLKCDFCTMADRPNYVGLEIFVHLWTRSSFLITPIGLVLKIFFPFPRFEDTNISR